MKSAKRDDKRILIELKDVWKTYVMGTVQVNALRGLSLQVKRGEFVSVMGPSGSGKSTAMNMIGVLDVPTKGTLYLEGQDVSKLHESDLAQIRGKKIGFIFQKFNLIPTLTALENVTLAMIFQGADSAEKEARARQLLELVGLGDRINHKPNELSGGEQQRVAIARALANDPEIMLADEPTGNLDSQSGEQIIKILDQLHKKEGKTIIIVTHELDIAKHAEKLYFLKDGKIEKVKKLR